MVADALSGAWQLVQLMPMGQVIAFATAIGVWLVGGEMLIKWHYVRRGKSWSHQFSYLAFPFKDFDGLEWSVGAFIFMLTLTLNQVAFALGH
jgi:hypothetical protein